jgi:hypothetical protein
MVEINTTVILRIIGTNSTGIIRRGGSARMWSRTDADVRFFKNRSWLRLEFPELIARTEADVGRS